MVKLLSSPFDAVLKEGDGSRTLVMDAYEKVRRDIIEGRLAPGSKLKVEHLKDNYNVGAGTLREALALLVTDALVTVQGQRGMRVSPISLDDFYDITETRVLLECQALRLSMEHGDDEWEASLIGSFHLLSIAEQRLNDREDETFNAWEMANRHFHAVLIRECRSLCLQRFLSTLYNQAERYRRMLLINRPMSRDVHKEHKAIFEATIARDADRATAVLSGHIRYNDKLLMELGPSAFAGNGEGEQPSSPRAGRATAGAKVAAAD